MLSSSTELQRWSFHVVERTRTTAKCTRMKNARAGRAKVLFQFTALFNNMRTLKFKAQPTNAFFATVNQMFGGSSQLPIMLFELYSTI